MKRTRHDSIPIGKARCGGFKLRDEIPAAEPGEDPDKAFRRELRRKNAAIREAAARLGVCHKSARQLFRRHPEMWDWSAEAVCRQVTLNKDQAAVAKRQGTERGHAIRGRFNTYTYSAPPELEES